MTRVFSEAALCHCGRRNWLPQVKVTRFYDPASGRWVAVESPQPGWPNHPCCHYWIAERGMNACRACDASRGAMHRRSEL